MEFQKSMADSTSIPSISFGGGTTNFCEPARQITDNYDNQYYIHSADHAGLQLATDRLTSGSDLHSWRKSIRMALYSK